MKSIGEDDKHACAHKQTREQCVPEEESFSGSFGGCVRKPVGTARANTNVCPETHFL